MHFSLLGHTGNYTYNGDAAATKYVDQAVTQLEQCHQNRKINEMMPQERGR